MVHPQKLFEELNSALAEQQITLSIICVGGFVLEHHGLRATQDIDAFYHENQMLREIIARIGEKHHVNTDELWLNNSVANMNISPPESICDTLYKFSNLIVRAVPIDYLLGMKLESGREQDLKDIGLIIQHEGFKAPFELVEQLRQQGFSQMDFSMLLEGFSYAYGMEWLENFYREHENQLEELF